MNPVMNKVWMLCLCAIFLAAPALAEEGNEGGHGGDEVALEFLNAFDRAWTYVKRSPSPAFADLKRKDIDAHIRGATILTVDEPLFVEWGDQRQESAAVNYPRAKLVKVNRARWRAISSPALAATLAFHEILSLAGLEQTGIYPYSGRYLSLVGSGAEPDPDLVWPKLPDVVTPPSSVAKVYSYQCRLRFLEGEGVSPAGMGCPAGQRLGFLTAKYSFYYASQKATRPPADLDYFDGGLCEYQGADRYTCDAKGTLEYGLAAEPNATFVVSIGGIASAPGKAGELGFAALPEPNGECPKGLVSMRQYVANPKSVFPRSIDGTNPPSNFVNVDGRLDSYQFTVEPPAPFVLSRAKNRVACESQHVDPFPRPAPGSCKDAQFERPRKLRETQYFPSEPLLCVIPKSSIRE